uniref:DNA (cytosine-5-)-methyltransferase n=1 Tax=Noctiluca scintillans TaxID=2966 RepID=A0A7S1FBL9_NOCSC
MEGDVAPWPEIQKLLDSGDVTWVPGLRVPRQSSLKEVPAQSSFSFCELFAGIGGFRLGLDVLGGHCVFASEIDKHAAATYALNFGETPAGDITECAEQDIPDFDLLTAGFPCQSFTTAGIRGGLDDPRGQMYREVC